MILGFDVSKNELVVVLIDKRGIIKRNWAIQNNKKVIEEFLLLNVQQYPKLIVACEATGEYHNVLAKCCLKKEIPFYLLNPIVTKQFTKATVRKKKTDLTDAHIIAKCVLQGEGQKIEWSIFNPIKPLLRTACHLGAMRVALNQKKKRFKEHFPELKVKEEFESIQKVIESSIEEFQEMAREKVDKELVVLLSSIPGIGKTLSLVFIAEIGDIKRFDSIKSLVAYAGLDPKVRQSGLTLQRNTRLTKRGSPYLRRVAYLAASIGQRFDPELKAYYEKKRAEGKRYKEATVANARHVLARIYAVWKRGTPYVPCSTEDSKRKALTQDCRSRTRINRTVLTKADLTIIPIPISERNKAVHDGIVS